MSTAPAPVATAPPPVVTSKTWVSPRVVNPQLNVMMQVPTVNKGVVNPKASVPPQGRFTEPLPAPHISPLMQPSPSQDRLNISTETLATPAQKRKDHAQIACGRPHFNGEQSAQAEVDI